MIIPKGILKKMFAVKYPVVALDYPFQQDGDATGEDYREGLASFITCPFCMGWWIALGWWGLWLAFPTETVGIAFGFAISAGVIGAQRLLSAE